MMHITYTHTHMYPCTVLQVTNEPPFGIEEEAPCVPLYELAAGQGPACRLHAIPLGAQRVVELPHIALGAGPFLCHMIRRRHAPRCGGIVRSNSVWHTNVCLKSLIHSSGSKLPSAISTHFLCHSFSSAKSKPLLRQAQSTVSKSL